MLLDAGIAAKQGTLPRHLDHLNTKDGTPLEQARPAALIISLVYSRFYDRDWQSLRQQCGSEHWQAAALLDGQSAGAAALPRCSCSCIHDRQRPMVSNVCLPEGLSWKLAEILHTRRLD